MSQLNTIAKTRTGGPDPSANQTATTARNQLTSFNVYDGTVIEVDRVGRTLRVMVNKITIPNCVYAPGALASYMGFGEVALPPVGSRVLVLYLPQGSYVLGTQPELTDDVTVFGGAVCGDPEDCVAAVGAFVPEDQSSDNPALPGYNTPADLLPGESSKQNNLGVALRMLYNFEQMSAGDLAKVEVHLLNDMVRIVDNYFVHHNVGGDTLIWSNGRCNYESHFTGYPFESEGKRKEDEELAKELSDNIVSIEGLGASATGRWRKSTYMGFLADMIHTWVTDPTKALSTYGDKADRAGKVRTWIGSDGTVMVQTTAGVHVEVTQRVVVPTMFNKWDDPEVDAAEQIKDLNKEFLKLWGKGPDWTDLDVSVWQMRSYARYITLFHSLSRFKQLEEKKGCKIPTETEAEAPQPTCMEADKEEANPNGNTPYKGNALFSMDPGGNIMLAAGGGTSIVLTKNGTVQIVSAGNMEFVSSGNMTFSAKNISMKAASHMQFAAILGAIKMKAQLAIDVLCELGHIWLKTDGYADNTQLNEQIAKSREGNIKHDFYPIIPNHDRFGIILDACRSRVLAHGARGVTLGTTEDDGHIYVQTTSEEASVNLFSRKCIRIVTKGELWIRALKSAIASACTKLTASIIKLGDNVRILNGRVDVQGICKVKTMFAVDGYIGSSVHVNKFRKREDAEPEVLAQAADEQGAIAQRLEMQHATVDYFAAELGKYYWSMCNWKPDRDLPVEHWASYKASLRDDTIAADPETKALFDELPLKDCESPPAPRTKYTMPWPCDGQYYCFDDKNMPAYGRPLDKPYTKDMIKTKDDMVLRPIPFYIRKSS